MTERKSEHTGNRTCCNSWCWFYKLRKLIQKSPYGMHVRFFVILIEFQEGVLAPGMNLTFSSDILSGR